MLASNVVLVRNIGTDMIMNDSPTSTGINRAITRLARCTGADLAALRVIEGAASYGTSSPAP